jgi:hypothetical protein
MQFESHAIAPTGPYALLVDSNAQGKAIAATMASQLEAAIVDGWPQNL